MRKLLKPLVLLYLALRVRNANKLGTMDDISGKVVW